MRVSDKEWGGRFPAAAKEALRDGKKLDAIRIFRQETGAGLAEAKDAVERYMANPAPWDASWKEDPFAAGDTCGSGAAAPPDRPAATVSPTAEAALFQGKLIEAVRIVRNENGIGLKDAKETVDRYVADHPTLSLQFERIRADSRTVWLSRLLVVTALAALAAAYLAWR